MNNSEATKEEVSGWHSTIPPCMRHAVELMQAHTMHGPLSERDRDALVRIIPKVPLSLHAGGEPLKDIRVLVDGLCMPGFVTGLEAIIRDSRLTADIGRMLRSTYAAHYLIEVIVLFMAAEKRPYREMLSLATTAHKLSVNYFQSAETQSNGRLMVWPHWGKNVLRQQVHCMTRVMLNSMPGDVTHPRPSDSHQLYLLMGSTVWPLIQILKLNIRGFGEAHLADYTMLRYMHDMTTKYPVSVVDGRLPELWSAFMRCNNTNCRNLDGVMDTALVTTLCSGCRRARYCSVACQRAAWKQGGHMVVCGKGFWSLPAHI